MMNSISLPRILAAAALALGCVAANATDFYFSDCADGAEAGCVRGDNRNSGTSPAAPKRDLDGFTIKSQGPGEHVLHFARGAAWVIQGRFFLGKLKNAGQALVLADYRPSWGTGTALPLLNFQASDDGHYAGFAVQVASSGYTLRNLDLNGPGDTGKRGGVGSGIYFYGAVSDVLMDNLTIRNFGIGVHIPQQMQPGAPKLDHITLRNSRITDNADQGLLGGGFNTTIENNQFDNNGFAQPNRNHNIYLSTYGENIVVRGNTLSRNAFVDGQCTAVSLVGHNHLVNTLIENNTIVEPAAGYGCYGIQINGYTSDTNKYMGFEGTIIRGNTVVLGQNGGVGIGVNACPGCIIENNVVVGLTKTTFVGIKVPDGTFTSAGAKDDAITVRNNSVYLASTSKDSVGIGVNAASAENDTVVNNLIYFSGSSNPGAKCFRTGGRSLASYAAFSNNACFRVGGPALWSDQAPTLAAAQAAGWDANSRSTDPLLRAIPSAGNGWSMALRPGSPDINAGVRVLAPAKDVLGLARDAAPDIGAFEAGNEAPAAPGAPTGLVVR